MCRTPISITPSDSRIRKRSDSRIFFWASSEHIIWSSSKISLIWAEWFSSRDLCQTPLVREPIKPAEFGSRFSSGGNQFSKEGSSKSYISNYPYRWLSLADCWRLYFDDGSCLLIKTSVFNDILLVVIKCCRFSSEGVKWRFLFFFDAGDLLDSSKLLFCTVISALLLKFSKSLFPVRLNCKTN